MTKMSPRIGFTDETSPKTTGWSPKHARLPRHASFGHCNTQTFVAALRHDRLDAPWVINGAMNRDLFELLCRDLARPDPARLRCDRPRQSFIAQKPKGRTGHARCRRVVPVPLFEENAPPGPFLITPTPRALI
ncbi:hypothetical protein [Roseovarius sp. SYSU LYC5161]|uniref:hypothetical protein n=1 Tax=Roseovarius halophilus (ex Wu et al. 2025) TaxID=3376060 RepID=UPI00399BD345